jgi:2-methylisocitrate lyase-like PEP mutase family enzyme
VAQIGAAHGLRGGVHLRSFTADPEAFATYGSLETEDRARRYVDAGADGIFVAGLTEPRDIEKLAAMPAKQRRGSKVQGPTALRFR